MFNLIFLLKNVTYFNLIEYTIYKPKIYNTATKDLLVYYLKEVISERAIEKSKL